jgi:hypothetical protein
VCERERETETETETERERVRETETERERVVCCVLARPPAGAPRSGARPRGGTAGAAALGAQQAEAGRGP